MKAKKGEWFSLRWEPLYYHDKASFFELKRCPKFFCVGKDTNSIESVLESRYPRLRLVSISLTTIFIKCKDGLRVPTHYRVGEFMPGDNTKYDFWIKSFYDLDNEISQQIKAKNTIQQKTIYLEHTAKIIRHDMHSGINTYMPRGLSSLLEKLPESAIKEYNLEKSITLLQEGLRHTQHVYKGVYAFTNLVKKKSQIEKENCNLQDVIIKSLERTSYSSNVTVENLCNASVNKSLFGTAVNNFIQNGMAYNDSNKKCVKIYLKSPNEIAIEDNGRGMTQFEYDLQCMPFIKSDLEEEITGMGINIANSILEEHGYSVYVDEIEGGTIIVINIKEGVL